MRAHSNEVKGKIVGQAARPLDHPRFAESELGDIVADAIRNATGADVALVNSGGIRTPIEAGPITYGQVFQSLPFDNNVSLVRITGEELKLLFRIAEAGARGFAPFSGLKLRVLDRSADAPSSDLNGDGKIEPWEVNRLLEMKFTDGTSVQPKKIYKLATIDFWSKAVTISAWFSLKSRRAASTSMRACSYAMPS